VLEVNIGNDPASPVAGCKIITVWTINAMLKWLYPSMHPLDVASLFDVSEKLTQTIYSKYRHREKEDDS
jgi:hypothetical protein